MDDFSIIFKEVCYSNRTLLVQIVALNMISCNVLSGNKSVNKEIDNKVEGYGVPGMLENVLRKRKSSIYIGYAAHDVHVFNPHGSVPSRNGANGGLLYRIINDMTFETGLNMIPVRHFMENYIEYSNGSLTDFAKALKNGTIDIYAVLSTLTIFRRKHYSFWMPINRERGYGYFVQPDFKKNFNGILPLTVECWSIFFGLRILGLIISLLISKQVIYFDKYTSNVKNDKNYGTFWNFAPLCQQGWYSIPKSTPSRIIFLTMMLMTCYIYWTVSAKLYYFMSSYSIQIPNFEKLVQQQLISIVVDDSSPLCYLLVDDVVPKSEWGSRIRPGCIKENFEDLIKGKLAFITYPDRFSYWLKTNHPSLTEGKVCKILDSVGKNNHRYIGLLSRKQFHLKELLGVKLQKLRETGLLIKYLNDYSKIGTVSCDPSNRSVTSDHSIHLINISAYFIAFVIGMMISLLIHFIEVSKRP